MAKIHSTAIVAPEAQLADDIEIGPYSIIGPEVKIGKGCTIDAYVQIKGKTSIGENNKFFHAARVGEIPQDFTFNNPSAHVVIGNGNTFREFSTVHLPVKAEQPTTIGDNNYFMNNSHIAHDCQVGNDCVTVSNAALGGYAILGNNSYISAYAAVHQFCRVGSFAMLTPHTKCSQDVPPFVLSEGSPAVAHSLNTVGMKRGGVGPQARSLIKQAFKLVYMRNLPVSRAVQEIEKELLAGLDKTSDEFKWLNLFTSFIKESKRGVIAFHKRH